MVTGAVLALQVTNSRARASGEACHELCLAPKPEEAPFDKLFNTFGLWGERPHELSGLRARLAARVALHNFCIRLNEQLGRPRLAFADLLGW